MLQFMLKICKSSGIMKYIPQTEAHRYQEKGVNILAKSLHKVEPTTSE